MNDNRTQESRKNQSDEKYVGTGRLCASELFFYAFREGLIPEHKIWYVKDFL